MMIKVLFGIALIMGITACTSGGGDTEEKDGQDTIINQDSLEEKNKTESDSLKNRDMMAFQTIG